jgi:hypothetical protein
LPFTSVSLNILHVSTKPRRAEQKKGKRKKKAEDRSSATLFPAWPGRRRRHRRRNIYTTDDDGKKAHLRVVHFVLSHDFDGDLAASLSVDSLVDV